MASATRTLAAKAAAERREQQMLAMRMWLKLLVLVIIFGGGSYWGIVTVTDPKLLPLKVVRTEGKLRYLQRQDLEQAVADLTTGGFLTVDVEAIRDRARVLPWVDRVSVRRVWPDSLQLWVEEQVPLSRWRDDAMLNVRGEVFHPKAGAIPPGFPGLSGPDGSEKKLAKYYLAIKHSLGALGLAIDEIAMDERRAWTMRLNNGTIVRFGNKDLDERLARFYRIYPLLLADKRQMKEVDLRYTNGFAVTWNSIAPSAWLGPKNKIMRGLV